MTDVNRRGPACLPELSTLSIIRPHPMGNSYGSIRSATKGTKGEACYA